MDSSCSGDLVGGALPWSSCAAALLTDLLLDEAPIAVGVTSSYPEAGVECDRGAPLQAPLAVEPDCFFDCVLSSRGEALCGPGVEVGADHGDKSEGCHVELGLIHPAQPIGARAS